MLVVYFGSFLAWFIVAFARGGFQWTELTKSFHWMITGWMVLLFPSGLLGIVLDASKVSIWLMAAVGYALYAYMYFIPRVIRARGRYRMFLIVFTIIVLVNHAGCVKVAREVSSTIGAP
jgi:hypothetical protein